ncbi:molybdenum ABC transporter ATP-binding protein [Rhodoligotrophos defluvii]|uniref:molybdenum ABC transporter ATP-binding protein n=1 Tax=Rhodoligotrophos defluvii TaxID=2561934 RepID=UPI0010C9532B|nr:molybdenum ABC transporter ATP-binding protein [Rhodoligotrophos defluvii]
MSLQVDIGHAAGTFSLEARFEVPQAGVTALFGPSGSGKTTTVNAIAGLITPRHGRIVLNGETVFDAARQISVPARARRVGYVFQDARLFPHLSVRSNLLFGWKRAGRPLGQVEIEEVIALLGLAPLLDRRPGKLSGGERQRVAIGRALLAAPRLLLLDEPLTALDAARREEILRYLERLRDHLALPMVYVTHSLDEVTRLADSIAVFDHGRVTAFGDIDAVLSRDDMQALAGKADAGAVIRATVLEHLPAFGVSRLSFSGGIITAPLVSRPVGTELRVRIRARDILVSRAAIAGEISANNVLPATITSLRGDGDEVELSLDCGGTRLFARITAYSCSRLGLAEGQAVYAIFKTVIIDRSPPAEP